MTISGQTSTSQFGEQERGSAAQHKMIEAAVDLIAEGGLGHATMARIGDRTGYSSGLTNFHFPSKSEIVEKAIDHIANVWLAMIQSPGPQSRDAGTVTRHRRRHDEPRGKSQDSARY